MDLALVRAFINAEGEGGNPALIIQEEPGQIWNDDRRLDVAVRCEVPATVFVEADHKRVRIFGSYGAAIAFAGHPTVATVEALHAWGREAQCLTLNTGTVQTRRDSLCGAVHITAPAAWSNPWRHRLMGSPDEIDALTQLPEGEDFTQVWAWLDKPAGVVRARLWAPRINKGEDKACGSASMILADRLQRPLTVVHGQGRCLISVIPQRNGIVELGGRCVIDPLPDHLRELVTQAAAS